MGNTPLHLCASRSNVEIGELLLESGANAGARNDRGQTALDLATDDEMRRLLCTATLTRVTNIGMDNWMHQGIQQLHAVHAFQNFKMWI